MENYLVVLLLSVLVLLGAFYVNTVDKRIVQIKDEMEKVKEQIDTLRKEIIEKDNAFRKEKDQMKETATRHENTLSEIKKAKKLCSQGWEEYEEHCYQFNTKQSNWDEAEIECMKQEGYLLKIDDANEFRWIVARAIAHSVDDIWIGLRQNKNEWKWVVDDQTARFQKWNTGEPNGIDPCVHMWSYFKYNWNDVPCDRKCSFVCEQR
ncbi:perlucin-like protein isoform X2 [Mytilus edulis]|uniref:perlucin-like protein isoform X2 n=1 Tax=Mytilus edulis TaxID=6550 RepID=UPI0039EF74DB